MRRATAALWLSFWGWFPCDLLRAHTGKAYVNLQKATWLSCNATTMGVLHKTVFQQDALGQECSIPPVRESGGREPRNVCTRCKELFARLILSLVSLSLSLSGVHPQARRGGAGVVPHITDTEDPHCPQAVPRIYAPGGPPPLAFIPPKCHRCRVLTLQRPPRYGLLAAFPGGCAAPRRFP